MVRGPRSSPSGQAVDGIAGYDPGYIPDRHSILNPPTSGSLSPSWSQLEQNPGRNGGAFGPRSRLGLGISAIVPTFNESENLPELLPILARSLAGKGLPAEIIVVDDASPDGTAEVAEELAPRLEVPLRVIRRQGPRSLSLSVVEGACAAMHDVIVILDADLTHDPGEVGQVLDPVLRGQADVVIGSRYVAGSRVSNRPLWRRALSAVGTGFARALTRVRDPLSGFFACKRERFAGGALELRPRGFKILLELLVHARGLKVAEVPISFRDRLRGKSKLGIREELEFLAQLLSLYSLRLRSRVSPRRPEARDRVQEVKVLR